MNIERVLRRILPPIVSCWVPGSRAVAPAYSPGTEELTDGGLEAWNSSTELTNWSCVVTGASTINREASDKHGGSYSCRIDVDASNNYAFIAQTVTLDVGQKYEVSFWHKTASGKTVYSFLQVVNGSDIYYLHPDGVFRKSGDEGYEDAYFYKGGTSGSWAQRQIVFDWPSRFGGINPTLFFITGGASSASIYIDDVSFVPMEDAGSEGLPLRVIDIIRGNHGLSAGLVIPEVPAHGYCKEMLVDGGLEVWTSATDLTNWVESIAGTSTVNRESTVKRKNGSYSCRLDVDGSNSTCEIYVDPLAGISNGKRYRFSMWYRTALGKTARLAFAAWGVNTYLQLDGTWGGSAVLLPASQTWAKVSIDFMAPADATGYGLYIGKNSAASSSIYLDDISLLEFQETLGPELLTDGGLETWASATDLTNWIEYKAGTSTVNREATEKHGGTYSCRCDVDASNSEARIRQTHFLRPGSKYRLSFWYKTTSGKQLDFQYVGSGNYLTSTGAWTTNPTAINIDSGGGWKLYSLDFWAHPDVSGYDLYIGHAYGTATSSSVYIDDITLKEIYSPPIQTDLGWTFDGKTGKISVADNDSLNGIVNGLTMGAWIKFKSKSDYQSILCFGDPSHARSYLYLSNADKPAARFLDGLGGDSEPVGDNAISQDKWYHIAGTADGTTARLYLNGAEIKNAAAAFSPSTDYGTNIGTFYDNTLFFLGSIAMPFVATRALSPKEIANMYRETKGLFFPRG